MSKLIAVASQEELNSDDPETRVWHAAVITSDKALCGVTAEWAGAGLLVTCAKCKQLMGDTA